MIRHSITEAKLRALITAKSSDWLDRAKARTIQFKKLGSYDERSSIWSEVKPVYMELQGESKCAYCERKLESVDYGKAEQDVEHFRPKGNVRPWKPSPGLKKLGLPLTPPVARGGGYYLLPYEIFNYGAACKPCNSALKSDKFPIAGKYRLKATNPAKMGAEKAYLVYPIGSIDEDPEALIEFEGASPRPRVQSQGYRRYRALVTIEFFALDDSVRRKNLFLERARLIDALFGQLETAATQGPRQGHAARNVVDYQSPKAPHSSCMRSFVRLYNSNRAQALALANAAADLIHSSS